MLDATVISKTMQEQRRHLPSNKSVKVYSVLQLCIFYIFMWHFTFTFVAKV